MDVDLFFTTSSEKNGNWDDEIPNIYIYIYMCVCVIIYICVCVCVCPQSRDGLGGTILLCPRARACGTLKTAASAVSPPA